MVRAIEENIDDRLNAISRGRTAAVLHADMADRITEREASIINGLVAKYRGITKPSYEELIGAVGAISEMRKLLSELQSEIKQGIEAKSKEYAQAG